MFNQLYKIIIISLAISTVFFLGLYIYSNLKVKSLVITNENQSKKLEVVPDLISGAEFTQKYRTVYKLSEPKEITHEELNLSIGKHSYTIGK